MGFGVSPFRCLPGCGVVGWARELPWAGENPGRREGELWKVMVFRVPSDYASARDADGGERQ